MVIELKKIKSVTNTPEQQFIILLFQSLILWELISFFLKHNLYKFLIEMKLDFSSIMKYVLCLHLS